MTRYRLAAALTLAGVLAAAPAVEAAEHRIGVGAHYWRALDDLVDDRFDIEEDGLAPYLTWQIRPGGLISFEVDVEYFEKGFGGATSAAWSPVAFVLIGSGWYGGVGIGVTVSDDLDDNVSDPFYAARIGLNMTILPRLYLDINANYRAGTFDSLDQASSDTVTLGAAVRIGL